MSTVSVTRLRVRSWRFLPQFLFHAARSARQVRKASGVQAATILREDWRTYWTRTIWTDEEAIRKFMISGNHRVAMPALRYICDEASIARWNQDGSTLPSWDEVHRRMQQEGRPSKVNNPTAAQKTFQIPAPPVHPFAEIRLK
jgi:heme-degrading monooxygenase HmoA